MKRILALLLSASLITPSIAADNAVVLTPGAGVTMRCKDVGGLVQSCLTILGDTSGNPILGIAGTPNANVLSVQGITGGTVIPITTSNINTTILNSSIPVTGTFWQATQPVSIAAPVTVTTSTINTNILNVNNNGQTTMANSSPIVIASNQSTITITNLSLGTVGSTAPTTAGLSGARSGANIVGIIQADTTKQISMSSATTTEMVALSGSTKIYATSYDIIAGGTTNVTFVYGTGSNCGTGTTSLAGLYALTAQAGIAKGSGLGPVLVVPAGNALCVVNSASVAIGGSLSYTQF